MKQLVVLGILILSPLLTSAHTKWFVDESMPIPPEGLTLLYFLILVGLVLFAVIAAVFFERKRWFSFDFLNPTSPHGFSRAASVFTMLTGAFLIIAGTHSYLFAPNLTESYGIPSYIITIQIAIGIACLFGIASRVSGILLALLWASLFLFISWIDALENIWVLSTAIFITLMGNEYFSVVSFSFLRDAVASFKKYALSILRIGTGATLIVLGLSEKVLAPEYGLNFLDTYHWNFMQYFGTYYSDYIFVLSAGAVEVLFGIIFVLGIMTRLNALIVAIVFTIPLFILGPIELTGHLPHFAAIILLLLFGGGGHFTFFSGKNYR